MSEPSGPKGMSLGWQIGPALTLCLALLIALLGPLRVAYGIRRRRMIEGGQDVAP
jgi:hypothetical protein